VVVFLGTCAVVHKIDYVNLDGRSAVGSFLVDRKVRTG
jgi:hypothetical protein